jgi:hypothetical protein
MIYARLLVLLFLVGCASKGPGDYITWASLPTPEVFQSNAKWSLFLLDKQGAIIRSMVVEFSQDSTQTCSSGDFKKLRIISEYPERSELFLGEPAYDIKGAALIIDLSANLCDAGYELRGKVSGVGVEGYHQPVSTFGGEIVGRFYGMPLTS